MRSYGLWIALTIISWTFTEKSNALVVIEDLGGNEWSATGKRPPSTVVNIIPHASVPGCIHTDWFNHTQKQSENEPYYRFNDLGLRWIAESDWEYKRTFELSKELLNSREISLVCEGLDTIGSISLNGRVVGHVKNMFHRHVFNVTGILQEKFNQIVVSFQSALVAANSTNATLSYSIPPECPPPVQKGFCHVNLIRKQQCSFSWDWGPAFATQGIYKPIFLLGFNEAIMDGTALAYDWDSQKLVVDTRFLTTGNNKVVHGSIGVFIKELSVEKHFNVSVTSSSKTTVQLSIPSNSLSLWWPNGQGEQKLYNITVTFQPHNGTDKSKKTTWFGFRRVELVQESINGSEGKSFYFKINNRPIFAKGSNWIPADAFQNRLNRANYSNLLQSVRDANMNILRVWGGGLYEREDFYALADQLGIMIWHDFMFACAMYRADSAFLQSVDKEVNETLWQLRSHPSIVIWAGNNENEAALGTDWYNVSNRFNLYKKDYVSLYIDNIGKQVSATDMSRPYLSSSPTNGVESKTEGWVSKNPYDTHYGDVHYYNYNDDCLDWTKYPKTRFASEYGFQSWPSVETLEPVSIAEDLAWDSKFAEHRQHHGDGNKQMLNQIQMHFKMPNTKAITEFEGLVYLSQVMQALCYKSQTEFYRRSRSEIVKGEGHTMGALYWQLNDIWQAPTWSSIEYGGKWKAVHYHAKNFFSKVALTAFDDDTVMTVYSISDENAPIEPVTLTIEMRQWRSFGVINTWTKPLYIVPQSAQSQYAESTGTMLHYGACEYKELCYFTIRLKEMPSVPVTFFYPVPFKDIDGLQKAEIKVQSVKYKSIRNESDSVVEKSHMFELFISSTAPAAFVWLEAVGVKGRFSDNSFIMYNPNRTVMFYSLDDSTAVEVIEKSIKITSLADLYDEKPYFHQRKPTGRLLEPVPPSDRVVEHETPTQVIYWLEDISAQVAFAIFGVLFIMFCAILLVCVVMRFNSPQLDKPPSSALTVANARHSRSGSQGSSPLLEKLEEYEMEQEAEGGAFLVRVKQGYGHTAKNTEIHFYIT